MTDETLLVAFTMDVECPGEGSRDAGFTDWDLGERALRGYAERLALEGWPVTFFIVPPAAPRYASALESLRRAGCELGLHVHPQDIGYPEFLGAFTEEEQVALLEDATARWADVFGFRPYSFRPGNCSANDGSFAALVRAGFRQGSVSIPERRMPALRAVWTGAPKDVHFAHKANRLLVGELDFLEVPVTVDWESMIWGGQTPLDLRIEAVDARSHSFTIAKNVVRMRSAGTPVKSLCAFTHNYFDYSDGHEFRRITLDGVVGYVRSIAAKHGLTVRGVTLEQMRHEAISSSAAGGAM
jgi:peptidoglycan/xylan/chitin deacetylase (PgdA/CDA1 family)